MGISLKYGPNQCFSHIYIPFIRLKTPPRSPAGTVLDIHRAREIGVDNGAQGVDLMIRYHVGRDPDHRRRGARGNGTKKRVLGGELPTARKWVITPVIYMG